MRKSGKLKAAVLALLCMIVVLVGGCQAIGNVDLNKALISSLDVQSMEGSGEISLSFQLDKASEVSESAEILQALNNMKLRLTHIKQENAAQVSVEGELVVSKGAVPFKASVTPTSLTIWPEGAAKPFMINTSRLNAEAGEGLEYGQPDWLTTLKEKAQNPDFLKPLYSYLVSKLPNPKNIKLDSGSETINGQSVYLYKVHTELKAEEIIPLVRAFVLSLMQDDQAMKAVISGYYDILQPALADVADGIGLMDELDGLPLEGFKNTLQADKAAGIEIIHTELKQVLVVLLTSLDGMAQESDGELEAALGADSALQTELYVDSSMKLRKYAIDLKIAPPEGFAPGLASMQLTASFENWNLNGAVKADVIDVKDSIPLDSIAEPADLLASLSPDSVLHKWLVSDLHVNRKTAYFFVRNEPSEYMYDGWGAYLENGTTMVPARTFANQLGLDMVWEENTQSLVLMTSTGEEKSIRLTKDSAAAPLNGGASTIALTQPVVLKGEYLYIPLRSVAEAFGGKVTVSDSSMVKVTLE